MSNNPFQRFKQKESGAKKKEKIRQEKKKVRQETREYFEQKKKAARQGFIAATSPDEKKRPNQDLKPKQPPKKQHQKADNAPEKNLSLKTAQESPLGARNKKAIHKNPLSPKHQSDDHLKHPSPTNPENQKHPSTMPINKFIAHAGICSRRDAADVVKSGTVTVNGKRITEPGFKVTSEDDIKVNGKKISSQKNLVYILLNKPKDFITTTEDPQGRKTVMDIVKSATSERVYPVGRLDRNTTGVLLLTNDGELAQKLSHPSYQIKKIYEVKLDKPLHKKDFDTILNGVQLEDGFIAPDVLAYADSKDKSVIGIEIHSGRNRIVRRIFEKLGYDVRNLDRVMYANLTKKNVERGKWRFLQEKEVRLLKYLNASLTKPK
jgi:23S rRNA pseudouridine2605 synthase